MRYYNAIKVKEMTYKKCMNTAKKNGLAFTRPTEWDGIHMIVDGIYTILTKDGQVIRNPEEVFDTKKKDWAVVVPTKRALKKLGLK